MNIRWYFFSISGLLLLSTGLCIFGEALTRKINQENYFIMGTLALIIFNSGICFVLTCFALIFLKPVLF